MIDWSKPIELVDGSPATLYKAGNGPGTRTVQCPSHPDSGGVTIRLFNADGTHRFGKVPDVRNKEMKMINTNKPVQCGGVDAKIIHTFDNGNLVVVVDGSTQVHNFQPDGSPVGDRGLILTNKTERTERWYCANMETYSLGKYNTLEQAKVYANNRGFVLMFKQTFEDGILVSTEVVDV